MAGAMTIWPARLGKDGQRILCGRATPIGPCIGEIARVETWGELRWASYPWGYVPGPDGVYAPTAKVARDWGDATARLRRPRSDGPLAPRRERVGTIVTTRARCPVCHCINVVPGGGTDPAWYYPVAGK